VRTEQVRGSASSGTKSATTTRAGALSHTGLSSATPWLGAAGISGALAGLILIMTARRRLAR
jgi:LPXTG-motif cell wall-anchored protein